MSEVTNSPERREFLKQTTIAAAGVALAGSVLSTSTASAAAPKTGVIKVGIVGVGGRGSGALNQALSADKDTVIWAMGEAFEGPLKSASRSFKNKYKDRYQADSREFVGLDAYKKVIDSGVDVVLLTTPPGFRPVHIRYALEAGKHVFAEKPIATDIEGVRSVIESAKMSKAKGLCFVIGFCWRFHPQKRAFYGQLLEGKIGKMLTYHGTYYGGVVKPMPPAANRAPGMGDLEWQVANWFNFNWLSGDGLVEQAIHSVDKMMWAMGDELPEYVVSVGGRATPTHGGNIYDHIECNYFWKDGRYASIVSRQQDGSYGENKDYIYATNGTATNGWDAGAFKMLDGTKVAVPVKDSTDMYQVEHNEMFAAIRAGQPMDNTSWAIGSCLVALAGRNAAYTGKKVALKEYLEKGVENLVPPADKWDMKNSWTVPERAVPGKNA